MLSRDLIFFYIDALGRSSLGAIYEISFTDSRVKPSF